MKHYHFTQPLFNTEVMMKQLKSFSRTIFILLFSLAVSLLFFSCENSNPIFVNNSTADTAENSSQAGQTVDGKTLKFISLGSMEQQGLNKTVAVEKYIVKLKGGNLEMEYESTNGKVHAAFYLSVPQNAIDHSKWIGMTFDDQNNAGITDIVFSPHGTQYSSPALFSLKTEGLDLSGVDPDNVKLYYVNENGLWDVMVCDKIIVDPSKGFVYVSNAQLPHFSRYALAAD